MRGMTTMRKTPIQLQELRRSIYTKAKAEKSHRFWGLHVHACRKETLAGAYAPARSNNGSPGIDGAGFEDIEKNGPNRFLEEPGAEL
jgi:RNA-directed DNA polymerase